MLRIGKRAKQGLLLNKKAGFTLIELALVAVVILIIISMSVPLFRKTFLRLELNNAALNIAKIIRFAEGRAITEGNIFKINFDFNKKTYWLTQNSDSAPGAFKNLKNDRFGAIFTLPQNIGIKGEKNYAVFYPDGRSDKITIILNSPEDTLYINSLGKAGYVSISEEKINE